MRYFLNTTLMLAPGAGNYCVHYHNDNSRVFQIPNGPIRSNLFILFICRGNQPGPPSTFNRGVHPLVDSVSNFPSRAFNQGQSDKNGPDLTIIHSLEKAREAFDEILPSNRDETRINLHALKKWNFDDRCIHYLLSKSDHKEGLEHGLQLLHHKAIPV